MNTPKATCRRTLFYLPCALLASLVLLALAGCGKSSSKGTTNGGNTQSSDDTVARIEGSSTKIDKTALNHWMRALAGSDFRQTIGTKGPRGLVSEPANYSECAAAAEKIVPRTFTGEAKLSNAQIDSKCRELYQALKAQALGLLISVQWSVTEGEEAGVHISDALLHEQFARFRKGAYPTEEDLQRYLTERQMTLPDILYQLKRNVLVARLLPKLHEQAKRSGGGEEAYAKLALKRYERMVARTVCAPGYVVLDCKEYNESTKTLPAPDNILEQFTQARVN